MHDSPGDGQDEAARQGRREALHRLAEQQPGAVRSPEGTNAAEGQGTPSSPGARRHPWSGRTVALRLGLVVLLLLVGVAATVALWQRPLGRTTPVATGPLVVLPRASGLQCPHDAAWSPDGAYVALVGYVGACLTPSYRAGQPYALDVLPQVPGIVTVYDAHTGKLASTQRPDSIIFSHIALSPAVERLLKSVGSKGDVPLGINYTHVLWSPDGRQLALTFEVFVPSDVPPQTSGIPVWPGSALDGVLLTDPSGSAPRVLLRPLDAAHPAYTIWDLRTGQPLPPDLRLRSTTPFATLLPAPVYQWGPDGTLVPGTTAGAPGVPSGGASFGLWQPGVVTPSLPGARGAPPLDVPALAVDISAWSPDGRYLLQRGTVEAVLATAPLPAAAQNALRAAGWADAPLLPVRDAGLERVLAAGRSASLGPAYTAMARPLVFGDAVAWSPDGRRLATVSQKDQTLYVYDSATGSVVARHAVPNSPYWARADATEALLLRWSRDGARLLVYDAQRGTLSVWALPG